MMDDTHKLNIISSAAELEQAKTNALREARHFVQLFSDRWLMGGGNEHTYIHRDDVNRLRNALIALNRVEQVRKVGDNGH